MKWSWLALLFACTPAAHPAPPPLTKLSPAAQPIVDAWAEAIGGRDRVRAAGALHVRGKLTKGGLTGPFDQWTTPRGERRDEHELAFLHEVIVFDGTRGWFVDRNREVRDLGGFEVDEELALAYLGANAAIAPERLAGTVDVDAHGALVLAPAGGHITLAISFDPATHLPVSFTRRDREKTRTTKLGDWRDVDGVRIPFAIEESNGDPDATEIVHLETAAHSLAPSFTRPADRPPDQAGNGEVPIELLPDGLIFVPVSINGTDLSMVLDSGAEATVLSSSRLARLHLTATGKFATGAGGGDVAVSYVPHVTTAVGGARVTDQIIAAIDLDDLEKPLGRPLDGILGYDFLSRFVIEIDYAAHRLRVRNRAGYQHAGTPLPISLEDSTPEIEATIEVPHRPPATGHFVLDTGCGCEIQLSTPFTDQHDLLSAVPEATQAGFSAGAGGETHQVSARITSLQIGTTRIDHPQADFARDAVGASADPETSGLIGALVWKRFVLVLDYKHRAVWLDPK